MKIKLSKKILTVLILSMISVTGWASNDIVRNKIEHRIIVGYNIGATAPIPLPREVRSVNSYWPQFTPQLGYTLTYNYAERWGVQAGVMLDYKGMGVQDKVKYMYTDVDMDGNNIKGYFTGRNETEVKSSYLTIPINLVYSINSKWIVKGGGYFSYRFSTEFTGTVWDGYLRKTDDKNIVNSENILIEEKDAATFDFGADMRKYDIGLNLGVERYINNKFGVSGTVTYGLTPVFPSKFTGIDMKMRNIYVTLGMSYKL